MQPSQVSIVILGSWNPRIFTPAWIKTNLFGLDTNQEIEGMINFEDMDFGFQHNGILLFPRTNLIEIKFDGFDNSKGVQASSIVIKILELLPQTPIKALGINIRYSLNKSDNTDFVNTIYGTSANFRNFQLSQLKQTLNNNNYQTNIITDILKDKLQVNFNFHYSKIAPFSSSFINQHYEETQQILKNGN
jgi:hypothetical protein